MVLARCCLVFLLVLPACRASPQSEATPAPAAVPTAPGLAEEIAAFERADASAMPPPNQVVFVGSSSIRRWTTLSSDLSPVPVINRGFGGSQTRDALLYAERIITKYEPSAVVIYEGDNDISVGDKQPVQVLADYEALVGRIRRALPTVPVFVLSIKPSPARWADWPAMHETNRLLQAMAERNESMYYVDVATVLLDDSKAIRGELFVEDGIHLNEAGYREWTSILRPHLARFRK